MLKGSNDEEDVDEKEDIVLSTNVPTRILDTQTDDESNDAEEATTEVRPSSSSLDERVDSIENEVQSNDKDGSGEKEQSKYISVLPT